MIRKDIEKRLISEGITILDFFVPLPLWKYYTNYRLNIIEKNIDKLKAKIDLDDVFFQKNKNIFDQYLDSDEFKEKISFILCEYLLLSVEDIKFEAFYIGFKRFIEQPEAEISYINEFMDLIKNLTKQDFKNLINLKHKIDLARESVKNGKLAIDDFSKHIFNKLNTKDSAKLLRYGLLEQNYFDITQLIDGGTWGKPNRSPTYEPKFKLSDYGEVFISLFSDIYSDIMI